MKNPPAGVKLVMAAVCVMKDIKPEKINDPAGTGGKVRGSHHVTDVVTYYYCKTTALVWKKLIFIQLPSLYENKFHTKYTSQVADTCGGLPVQKCVYEISILPSYTTVVCS